MNEWIRGRVRHGVWQSLTGYTAYLGGSPPCNRWILAYYSRPVRLFDCRIPLRVREPVKQPSASRPWLDCSCWCKSLPANWVGNGAMGLETFECVTSRKRVVVWSRMLGWSVQGTASGQVISGLRFVSLQCRVQPQRYRADLLAGR